MGRAVSRAKVIDRDMEARVYTAFEIQIADIFAPFCPDAAAVRSRRVKANVTFNNKKEPLLRADPQ